MERRTREDAAQREVMERQFRDEVASVTEQLRREAAESEAGRMYLITVLHSIPLTRH